MREGLETNIRNLQEELDNYKAQVKQYLNFNSSEGLIIGATNSATGEEESFRTVIDNHSLSFQYNATTVAAITDNQLSINNARINNDMQIGRFYF